MFGDSFYFGNREKPWNHWSLSLLTNFTLNDQNCILLFCFPDVKSCFEKVLEWGDEGEAESNESLKAHN